MTYNKSLVVLLFIFSFNVSALTKFSSEDSVGVNLTGGNADLKTWILKSRNELDWDKHMFKFNGNYLYGESNKIRSSENWSVELRYDRKLFEKFGIFFGELVESDRFAGFSRRYNTDAGAKYTFSESDKSTFLVELGYRYSIEKSVDDNIEDQKDSKGRLYVEGKRQFNSSVSGRIWVEYLPNFSVTEDYQVNVEPSLTANLTTVMALNSSYTWKYNNVPNAGSGKHDYTMALTLIAKF